MSKGTTFLFLLTTVLIVLVAAACAPAAPAPAAGDPTAGAQTWAQKPCVGCHGPDAQGVVGPKLAGTSLSLDQVVQTVRNGKEEMPKFGTDQVSDKELADIYAWLKTLQ